MTTEVTACLMIGPVSANSAHGKPAPTPAGALFCPSHVLVLMEGARATWVLQECPALGDRSPTSRIQPQSSEYLLSAALLGYSALNAPGALHRAARLRNAITPSTGDALRIGEMDRNLAAELFTVCAEHVYGVITVLPGSSITDNELGIAAGCGMRVAVATSAVGASRERVASQR
jgi:hypothetical protein